MSTDGLTVESFTYNGKTFNAIHGTTSTQIQFFCESLPHYTLFSVARYSGQGARGRIFTSDNCGGCGTPDNWLSGYWGGNSGVAFHGGETCQWLTPQTDVHQNDWVVSSDTSSSYRSNSVSRGSKECTRPLPSLAINRCTNDENSDFIVADVIIVKEELSLSAIQAIETALMLKYGFKGICFPIIIQLLLQLLISFKRLRTL